MIINNILNEKIIRNCIIITITIKKIKKGLFQKNYIVQKESDIVVFYQEFLLA